MKSLEEELIDKDKEINRIRRISNLRPRTKQPDPTKDFLQNL